MGNQGTIVKHKARSKIYLLYSATKLIFGIPLALIYHLSKKLPKDKKTWVFGAYKGNVFRDNSKYFYLHVHERHPEIKAIWISRNKKLVKELKEKGFNAVYKWSFKGMFKALRAGVVVYDFSPMSVNQYLANAFDVQLWHGLPLKKIGLDNNSPSNVMKPILQSKGIKRFLYNLIMPHVFKKPNILVNTSEFFTSIFSSAFGCPESIIKITGYPRNDIFFKEIKGNLIIVDQQSLETIKKARATGKKVIIYMPTFRDSGEPPINEILNFTELNNKLNEMNAIFIIKHHELSSIADLLREEKVDNFSNIIVIDPAMDVYPILPHVDLLVTDYSSVFFDFLLLDKPIIFHAHDLEKYLEKDREMYFDYEKFVPGPITRNFDELITCIEKILVHEEDGHVDARRSLKEKVFAHHDGNSSARLFAEIKKQINLKN